MEFTTRTERLDGSKVEVVAVSEADVSSGLQAPYYAGDDGELLAVRETEHPLLGQSRVTHVGRTSSGDIVVGRLFGADEDDSYAVDVISGSSVDGGEIQSYTGSELEAELDSTCAEWERVDS